MAPLLAQATQSGTKKPNDEKALQIIARSLFRELKDYGYSSRQIISLSTEIIGLVTSDLQGEKATPVATRKAS